MSKQFRDSFQHHRSMIFIIMRVRKQWLIIARIKRARRNQSGHSRLPYHRPDATAYNMVELEVSAFLFHFFSMHITSFLIHFTFIKRNASFDEVFFFLHCCFPLRYNAYTFFVGLVRARARSLIYPSNTSAHGWYICIIILVITENGKTQIGLKFICVQCVAVADDDLPHGNRR